MIVYSHVKNSECTIAIGFGIMLSLSLIWNNSAYAQLLNSSALTNTNDKGSSVKLTLPAIASNNIEEQEKEEEQEEEKVNNIRRDLERVLLKETVSSDVLQKDEAEVQTTNHARDVPFDFKLPIPFP
jgi:hypothetical protein